MKFLFLLLISTFMMNAQDTLPSRSWIAYIGTYTQGESRGIYSLRYDPATGGLTPLAVTESVSPSFLALHPNGRTLYAVNESRRYNGNANSGSVSAFSIDFTTGDLKPLNTVASLGAAPCHVTADRSGRWLFVANYGGGSVAVFPINGDGSLREAAQVMEHGGASNADPARQEAPHAHSVDVSSDNKFLYVSDLGNDTIFVYSFDEASGKLVQHSEAKLKPGAGPRHLAFSRDRRYLYSLNELTAMVTAFRHDSATAALEEIQTISTLPADFTGAKSGAEIAVDPSGRFLYTSNRGHDSIAIFSIDAEQGRLTAKGTLSTGGKTPRHFAIDASGMHLITANQDSGDLVVFNVDSNTGALAQAGESVKVPSPVCVLLVQVP